MITDPPKKVNIGEVVADPFGDGDVTDVAIGEVVSDPFGDGGDEIVAAKEPPVIGTPPISQQPTDGVPPLLAGQQPVPFQPAEPGAPISGPVRQDAAGDELAIAPEGVLSNAQREEFLQRAATISLRDDRRGADDINRALATDTYLRERPEKVVAKASQAEQYPLFSEQAERLGPAKPYDFQNLDDPRRKTIEQDALKFAATDQTILPYSVAKMENMKQQGLWRNKEEATYQGAILSHAQDVIEGKELLLKQGMDSGIIDPRHAQLMAKDIEAKKQYIAAGWAAVQKIDPRTVADKLREKNKMQADAAHAIGLTGQKDAVVKSIVGGLVQSTMNTVTKPILMAYDQLFTDDDQVSGADRLINAISEVGKDLDSYRPTAYDKPLYEKNKETGEVIWNPDGVLPQTAGAISQLVPFVVVGGLGGSAATAIGEKATAGTAASIFGTTYADTYDRFVRTAMEQNKPGDFIPQEMAEKYAHIPAAVAATVFSINPNLKMPVVMAEAQAAAMSALKQGVGPQAAMRSVMASVLKGGGTQVGLNLAITAADTVAKNAINDVSTTGSMTLPSGQEIINSTIGAFLLGGLLGLKDNSVITGARAEGLKFAAENPEQMRKIIDGLPFANEADRKMYHEQMGKLVKTYEGNGLSDMPPPQAAKIAGLLTEKNDLVAKAKETKMDPVIEAVKGNPDKRRIVELSAEIARRKGLTEDETALALASQGYLTMPEGASMTKNPDGSFTLKVKEAKEGEKGMTEEQVLEDLRSQLPPVAATEVSEAGDPVRSEATTVIETTSEPMVIHKGVRGKVDADGNKITAHPNAKGVFGSTDEKVAQRYEDPGKTPVRFDIPPGTTIETVEINDKEGTIDEYRDKETEAINNSTAQVVRLITRDNGKGGKQTQYVIKDEALLGAKPETQEQPRQASAEAAARRAAAVLERAKLTADVLYALPIPPQVWNGVISAMQSTLIAGGKAADMIASAIKHIQSTEWWSGASEEDRKSVIETMESKRQDLEASIDEEDRAVRKTAEQSAAERLASGDQRINAPDNPVSEQVAAESMSKGAKGDGMVTVNERAALRDRLKDLAKATKEAFKKGVSEGTLAGEMHGKAEGRKEGSKESETHAERARKVMTDAVKMAIDPIRGKLTPGQSRSLASVVAKTDPTSITQVNKLLDKIDSIVADANYADKLLDFKKLRSRIIAAAKSKKGESARLAEEFAKLDAEQADIDTHIKLGQDILKSLRVVDKDGATQPINNGELLDYINKQLDVQAQKKARDDHDELVDYALSIGGMDIPLDKIKEIRDQIDEAYAPVMKEIKRIAEEKSMDELRAAASKAQKDLKAHKPTHAEEMEVVDRLSRMDLSKLSKDQLKDLVFTVGNIIRNNDYAAARKLASKTPAQQFIEELGKETMKLGRPGTENQTLNSLDTMAITMEKIFRTPEKAAHYKLLMGLEPVMNALSDARHKTEQKQARRDQIAKAHKVEDSVLNRYRAATYAYLIQNYGGTPEQQQADFETAAQNLRDSIKNINSSKTEKRHKEYLRFREQALNEILGDAKTVADLKPPAGINAIVDNEIKEFADANPMHDRSASMDYGERPRAVSNYTPTRTVKLFGHERGQRRVGELFDPARGDSGVNPEMASAKHERVQRLPDGSAVDLDFFDVTDDSYQQSMEDSLGARHINVMREIFNSGALDELMGPDTKKMLKERIHNILNSEEIARTGLSTTDKYWRRAGRISARIALSGLGQLPKQLTVGVSTAAALGKDMDLLPASYGDAAIAMANEESWQNKLMEGEQVHERGRVMGGVEKVGQSITREALLLGDEKDVAKYRKIIGHKVGVGADQLGYLFLKIGDVLSAQAAWLAYYKQHLRSKGVNLDDDAWKTSKDPEAASYANHMVERSQNANTIPALPEAYRQPGGTKYFLDYAMSFSSFALNTKKRQARDIKMLLTGAKEDKWFAFRDLVGATLEQILFSMAQVAIAGVGLYVANSIIKWITGDDPELNKKARSYWEKVMSRAAWDTVFGGLPDAASSVPKTMINKLTHNKEKDDLFYVRKGSTLGLFDPLSEQTGMLIQGVADVFGKEDTDDKQLAGVLAAVTLMNMTTLADQTLTIPFTREASRKLSKKEKKGSTLFPAP